MAGFLYNSATFDYEITTSEIRAWDSSICIGTRNLMEMPEEQALFRQIFFVCGGSVNRMKSLPILKIEYDESSLRKVVSFVLHQCPNVENLRLCAFYDIYPNICDMIAQKYCSQLFSFDCDVSDLGLTGLPI